MVSLCLPFSEKANHSQTFNSRSIISRQPLNSMKERFLEIQTSFAAPP